LLSFTLTGGNLYNTSGGQQQLIDTGVQAFAVVNNRVFDVHSDSSLQSMNPDGSGKTTLLQNGATQLVVGDSGSTAFFLTAGGALYSVNPSHGFQQEQIGDASGVAQLVVGDSGTTDFARLNDGQVWVRNVNSPWGNYFGNDVTQLVLGDSGSTTYFLAATGGLYSENSSYGFRQESIGDASGVAQLVVGDSGFTDFARLNDGQVWVRNINSPWGNYFGNDVTQLVLGDNGYTTFFLTAAGGLYSVNRTHNFQPESIGDASGVAQLVVGDSDYTEFARLNDGQVWARNINSPWGNYFGNDVTQLVLGDSGYTTFFLTPARGLYSVNRTHNFQPESIGDASGVAQLVVGDSGTTEFVLMHDGTVLAHDIGGGWGNYLGDNVTQLVVGDSGYTTFFLTATGALYSENRTHNSQQEQIGDASGVAQLVVGDSDYTDFARLNDGQVWVRNINSPWGNYFGNDVTQLVLGDSGYTTFFLTPARGLYSVNRLHNFQQEQIGDASGVAQLVVGDSGYTEFARLNDGQVWARNVNSPWSEYTAGISRVAVNNTGYTTFFQGSDGGLHSVNRSSGFVNCGLSTSLVLQGGVLPSGTGAGTLVGMFRTASACAGQFRPPTYSLTGAEPDNAFFQILAGGGSLMTAAPISQASYTIQVRTDVGLGPIYGLDTLVIPVGAVVTGPITPVAPPPAAPAGGLMARLVVVRVGKRKKTTRRMVELFDADTGVVEESFVAPFQGPEYTNVRVSVHGNQMVVTARRGKKKLTRTYPA
jgi:hypothetical protein